jgi:hypothetical protein
MGGSCQEDVVGLLSHDYLADDYIRDDRRVLETGVPLINHVEPWRNDQGLRDWIVTEKHPLHGPAGRVVGLIATFTGFEAGGGRWPRSVIRGRVQAAAHDLTHTARRVAAVTMRYG